MKINLRCISREREELQKLIQIMERNYRFCIQTSDFIQDWDPKKGYRLYLTVADKKDDQ